MRKCLGCDASLEGEHHNRKYCEDCIEKRRSDLQGQYAQKRNDNRGKMRLIQRARRACKSCGELLPIETINTPKIEFCPDCSAQRHREQSARYHREGRKNVSEGVGLEEFVCQDCGNSFLHPVGARGYDKKFCDVCLKTHHAEASRECMRRYRSRRKEGS